MAEYIEKEALLKAARKNRAIGLCEADIVDVQTIINEQPTADVQTVVHGRWVMTLYTTISKRNRVISNKKFACTECGYSNGRKQSNYCPNCGAKMDAEE